MKKKIVWVVVSCLMVLALLAASCAKAEEKAPAPVAKEAAPVVKEAAPVVKEAAPAEVKAPRVIGGEVIPAAKEVIPPGRKAIKVTLTKRDGTPVELLVEKPQYGGQLIIAYPGTILTWDEATTSPWSVGGYCDETHEALLTADWTWGPAGTGETWFQQRAWFDHIYQTGALAESWEILDNETIIFHIRKGVRWHNKPPVNGRELVADDVVYNIKRIYFDIKTSTMYGMAGVSGPTDVYAKDKYTVVVKNPPGFTYATLEYVAAWTKIYAPEVEAKYGSQNVDARGVGTGPFLITDYVPMSSVTYVRNPDYWGRDPMFPENQEPYLDGIKLVNIPDMSTRLAALRTGKTDCSGTSSSTIPQEQALSLVKTAPHLFYRNYPVCGRNLAMPRLDKNLPSNDIRVRRALMMALDKQTWAEAVLGLKGDQIQLVSYPVPAVAPEFARGYTPLAELPPSADGFDTKKLYGYYPEEAKKLLAEAGYPNGFKTETVYTAGSTSYGVVIDDVMAFYKNQWAKIGVELILDPKTAAVRNSMYQRKTFNEICVQSQTTAVVPSMFTARAGNMYNTAMVNDPKVDDYYARLAVAMPRSDEWWQILKESNVYQIQQVFYTSLPPAYEWVFWQPWLRRYYGEHTIGSMQYGGGGWIERVWIDRELKKAMGY